jgi:hypothetical protein
MNINLVAVLIGSVWVIGVMLLCGLVRGGALNEKREKRQREIDERRARVASFLESKSLQ